MPFVPPLVPALFFPQLFPAASNRTHPRDGHSSGDIIYSTEGLDYSNWSLNVSCGWFPVLVMYPGSQPIPAQAWVHISPSPWFLPRSLHPIPPYFGSIRVSPNSIYVGRQYLHTFPLVSRAEV